MSALTTSLALRAAINVLRDSAESRKMPSGDVRRGDELMALVSQVKQAAKHAYSK